MLPDLLSTSTDALREEPVRLGNRRAYEDWGFTEQHDKHQHSGESQVHSCKCYEVHRGQSERVDAEHDARSLYTCIICVNASMTIA